MAESLVAGARRTGLEPKDLMPAYQVFGRDAVQRAIGWQSSLTRHRDDPSGDADPFEHELVRGRNRPFELLIELTDT